MESRFWQYFHDKLSWPGIFAPGPLSAVVKGLALYMDDVREDILWLRRQFTPTTADDDMIERYGASRGVLRCRFDTTESYRLRVVNAYAWHKLGGKVAGLTRILAENGFLDADILPVNDVRRHDGTLAHHGRDDYGAGLCWAQFNVKLAIPETGLDTEVMAWLRWLVNTYKPARSILRALSWQTGMDDAADCVDEQRSRVAASAEDRQPWGWPLHDGSIHYNHGWYRNHRGRLKHDGAAVYTPWEAFGQGHDTELDPANVGVRPALAEAVRFRTLHDGALLYNGANRRGVQDVPALDAVATGLETAVEERIAMAEATAAAVDVSEQERVGQYHDGSLSHGQRYARIRDGGFYHDGTARRGLYGGKAAFYAVRHDGRAAHGGEARHTLWGWVPGTASAPIFTYQTLSDSCVTRAACKAMDGFALHDFISVGVYRYTLHNGKALHNGTGPEYGAQEV